MSKIYRDNNVTGELYFVPLYNSKADGSVFGVEIKPSYNGGNWWSEPRTHSRFYVDKLDYVCDVDIYNGFINAVDKAVTEHYLAIRQGGKDV